MFGITRTFGGVTIHYVGKVASAEDVAKVLQVASAFATSKHWVITDASPPSGTLDRSVGDRRQTYSGRVRGLRIQIAPMCEPLFIQIGDDLIMQDFVKTQFAGAEAHIGAIELLEAIKPFLRSLDVVDEGAYWGSHDKKALLQNLEAVNLMMENIKKNHPDAKGPIVLENGRVIDIAR
jgi:hypothetical protein